MENINPGFNEEGIQLRDNLQFELKSEFFINPRLKENVYKQEFFLFVADTLQINKNTYSKQQFYLDQTNLIRYKTPRISLQNLIKEDNIQSPLARLIALKNFPLGQEAVKMVLDELRLFGNMFRASLHEQIQRLANQLEINASDIRIEEIKQGIFALCNEVKSLYTVFQNIQNDLIKHDIETKLKHYLEYTDEFINQIVDYDFTILLHQVRNNKLTTNWKEIDHTLCEIISQAQNHLKVYFSQSPQGNPFFKEKVLYRHGLLNKFMLEALRLQTNRFSREEKHGHLLGAISAGVAMFIYMILFWKSTNFGINSLSVILLVVLLYILKDRLKEEIKNLYYKQAYRWFPDYTTEIKSPKGYTVGRLTENFSFINVSQLPTDFLEMRNRDFHEELPDVDRPETIMQYKREVTLYQRHQSVEDRRRELTMVFRFNLHRFLQKANNPLQPYLTLNRKTHVIEKRLMPKVYHINIIIKNTYLLFNLKQKVELKKFRIVIDKRGIKRIEQIA